MKLSLHQVARALDSPVETIERWVRQGRIPIRKNGDTYLFETEILEKWAAHHNFTFILPTECNDGESICRGTETLLESMKVGGVYHNIAGNDAQSALFSAIAAIPALVPEHQTELFQRLMERETLASTGIGSGIAIPHPRTPLSTPLSPSRIITCFLKNPIDFNAIDDKPVFMFFILLSPSVKSHLHLLSRLSFCVRNNDFVTFLRQKPQSQDIFQKIAAFEYTIDKEN